MFAPRDRLLVFAPHPDDETLATAGLLQRAAACGAATRVVFATDGDDNRWPQRVIERRVRLGAEARMRWGARRRDEARAALRALGLPQTSAVFLGLPDRGVTRLLLERPASVVHDLATEIAAWRPSVIVTPSLRDRHPDHNALAMLLLEAVASLERDERPIVLTYVVHPVDAPFCRDAFTLRLTPGEQVGKRRALDCHAAQLLFHRRTTARRAACPVERFALPSPATQASATMAIRDVTMEDRALRIRLSGWRWRWRPASLLVVSRTAAGIVLPLRLRVVPGRARVVARDPSSGAVVAHGSRSVRGGETTVALELPRVPTTPTSRHLWPIVRGRVFVKLVTPLRFFDCEGWAESSSTVQGPVATLGPVRAAAPRSYEPARA